MDNHELSDVMTAVSGLVSVFENQLRVAPATIAIDVFKILVNYLDGIYKDTDKIYQDKTQFSDIMVAVKKKVCHFYISFFLTRIFIF